MLTCVPHTKQRTVERPILGRHEEDMRTIRDRVRAEQICEGEVGPAQPQQGCGVTAESQAEHYSISSTLS